MKVRALEQFNDLTEMKFRRKNDVFYVTDERFEEINSTSFGTLIEVIIEEEDKIISKPKRNTKKRGV